MNVIQVSYNTGYKRARVNVTRLKTRASWDNELLSQFKEVEKLNSTDKNTIKDIIDAFIKRSKLNQIAAL